MNQEFGETAKYGEETIDIGNEFFPKLLFQCLNETFP